MTTSTNYYKIRLMVPENSAELRKEQSRYFVGDTKSETFKETRGYFVGFFLRGKVSTEGQSLDILGREDIECAVMDLPEVDSSPPHYHKLGYEITYCLSGKLHLIIDHKDRVDLSENQFLVIPPETVLQNPTNDSGTKVFVVRNISTPGDKYYAK